MPLVGVTRLERQAKEHGYAITVKVKESGQAVVTLKESYASTTIEANSGDVIGASRYDIALQIAVERMLDFVYRSKPAERPALGEVR